MKLFLDWYPIIQLAFYCGILNTSFHYQSMTQYRLVRCPEAGLPADFRKAADKAKIESAPGKQALHVRSFNERLLTLQG